MVKAGIVGAAGYSGKELIRILNGHPDVDVVSLTDKQFIGAGIAEVFPEFLGQIDAVIEDFDVKVVSDLCDVVRRLCQQCFNNMGVFLFSFCALFGNCCSNINVFVLFQNIQSFYDDRGGNEGHITLDVYDEVWVYVGSFFEYLICVIYAICTTR